MPYRVKLTETVRETVSHFHPEIKKFAQIALEEIAQNPFHGKELQEGLAGFLSYSFKRYRIIYTVDDASATIIVHLVWHRRNVYELLEKLIPAQKGK